MRVRIDHRTTYTYQAPATDIVQALRVWPRDHEGQHICHWRLDLDVDGHRREATDAFGNHVHMFYAEGAVATLTIRVCGEAEVTDTAGIIRGAPEPLPPAIFLRSTPLTTADDAIVALAEGVRRADTLSCLHALLSTLHEQMIFDESATETHTAASDALAAGRGVCQDFAHIFTSAARYLGIPARYTSGHLARTEEAQQNAAHAWAEALVPDLGWVAFDPANGICATDAYVRVAVGLDYLDAAPVRGARRGGGAEALAVAVQATGSLRQSQTQG